MAKLFIGVDGGATKCTLRVENEAGDLIGQSASGPANIRLSVEQSWQSILAALENVIPDYRQHDLHAGMGLAGCELADARAAFLKYKHPFQTLRVVSDAHTACLGAHAGKDGAIVIIGTGMVGLKCEQGLITGKVGGWGFPHDDLGSGSWLGLEAMKITLQAMDGRIADSKLASDICSHFDHDQLRVVDWANTAKSTQFAELAPIVIAASQVGDPDAVRLMQMAAAEIERAISALALGALPLALIGGVAPFIQPLLSARVVSAVATPEAGAIYLMKQQDKPGRELVQHNIHTVN